MDELAWASLWLFKATGDPAYLEAAKKDYALCCSGPLYTAFTWDNKAPAVQLMMYRITGASRRVATPCTPSGTHARSV
jgi:endoglucanase